jgi:carboxyl-terminal processing protease
MAVFTDVLRHIKSDYVEEPNLNNVTLGALNGLLESVDPFASYLNADQYKQYLRDKDAYKGDVGLVLAKRYGYVGVVGVLPGSPAAKAGISTGDLVESIKGVATRDMPLAYAEILLKGQPGADVEIQLLKVPDPEPQKVTLTRAVVAIPPVTVRMLPEQVGYVRPETLVAGKSAEVAAAVRSLEQQGAKRFILDLRNCAVGVPEEGIVLANLFLDKGLMTYLQGQQVPRKDFQADPAKAITRLPLVVTVNRGTADGAEIAAAALLENKRASVVGERSFGDAAVRRAIGLDDGGALILSVAKYYGPLGKAIQDTGVIPSVAYVESEPAIDLEDETAAQPQPPPAPAKPEDDSLLKKAVEVLMKAPTQ